MMENALKDLCKDDLGLAILATLYQVLFLTLILLKALSFISLKKIDFLKLNFQLRPQGFFFDRKGKRLGLYPSHKRSPGNTFVIFLQIFCFSVNINTKTAKKKSFLKRGYNIIL